MSKHYPNIYYPALQPAADWRRYSRNGLPVSGPLGKALAENTNHITAFRRKIWGIKSLPLWDGTSGVSLIPGAISGGDAFYFAGHTGEGVEYLEAYFILAKDDTGTGADPLVYLSVYDVLNATTTLSNVVQYGVSTAAPSDTPNEFGYGRVQVAVSENLEYYVTVKTLDYSRIVACTLYEIGRDPVDTVYHGIDPGVHTGVNVLDSQMQNLLVTQTDLWQHNAGPIIQWTRDTAALAPTSTTSGSYVNIIDQTLSSVTAASPGVRTNLQYHNTVAQTTVPVKMVVRATVTDLSGASGANNAVRVTDGTNSIAITGLAAGTSWYSTTGTMAASDAVKWDIQFSRNYTGVYEGTLDTLVLDAVYVYEWQEGTTEPISNTLLAAINAVGLSTPVVGVDFSEVASGSFTNYGTDGGTFDPSGTPLYSQTFPSPIGGNAVMFDNVSTDYFSASSATIGDTTTDPIAVFAVVAATSGGSLTNIVAKRNAAFGAGWEMRVSTTDLYTAVIEDDDGDTGTASPTGDILDNTGNYVAMRVDVAGDTIYAWHTDSGSEASGAIAGTNTTFTSSNPIRIGDDQRDAFGAGGGMIRYLVVWRGSSALDFDQTAADALFAELTP